LFDTVQLVVFGPFWRPNTRAYFDDFSIETGTTAPVPEPATFVLALGGVAGLLLVKRLRR